MSRRRIVAALAGPALIVAFVVFALRGFVFADRLTNEHPDILAFWLPRWTFLGRTLAAGHLPLWNPYEMLGYRFAADPQSGWLAAAPSLLFAWLSPGVAMRAMIVLHPILAGLGLFGFLRIEGFGRTSATMGGLALAGVMAASEIAIAMPFAGAVAWTTIALLGAAGFLRAPRWSRRLAWLALVGFAWGQIASAHLSHGLVAGTALLAVYAIAHAWGQGRRLQVALLLIAPVVLSIAILAPRFQFLHASSLGQGYDRLGTTALGAVGSDDAPIAEGGVWAGWPLAFASAPGAYLGAAALLAVPLALRARRRRPLVIAAAGVLIATWLLLWLLGLGWVRAAIDAVPFGDVLLHNPSRLRYVVVLTLPILAAAGLQGLLDDPPDVHRAWVWVAAGAVLWVGVPLAFGAYPVRWIIIGLALVPAAWLLVQVARRPSWAPAVVALLVVELTASLLWGNAVTGDELRTGLEGDRGGPLAFQPLRAPDVDAAAFLRPGPFVARIGDARYLTWAPPAAAYEKGYLFAQEPTDWPALANERGTLFGIRDALGYNPVQLPAYWTWMRAHNPLPMYYNTAVLARPTLEDLRALGVSYLVVPEGVPPTAAGSVVATADGYSLIAVPAPPAGGDQVTRVSPTRIHIAGAGTIAVDESFDPGWRAVTDDGRSATIAADGPTMTVTLPGGATSATLTYHDPWVIGSLWAGVAAWLVLLAAWALAVRRDRRLA